MTDLASPPVATDTGSPPRSGRVRSALRAEPGSPMASWWAPLAIFAAVGVAVWVAVWFGNVHLEHDPFFPVRDSVGEALFGGWARWDAEWYRTIVREGYVYFPDVQSSVAFWPAYPVVVKAFSWAFPSIYITGTIVTLVSGATAAVLLRKWTSVFLSPSVAITAVVVLCVYPYSWYLYGAVYSDALFLASVLAAFVLLERDRTLLAGLVGIVATAGRPSGLIVAVVLVLRVVERRNRAAGVTGWRALDPRSMTRADAPVLFSWLGVGGWIVFQWVRFGDPLMFVKAQSEWQQGAGPSTWLKFRVFDEIVNRPSEWSTIGHLVHGAVVIAALFLLPRVKRRFGWAYTLYCAGIIALPLVGTKDFQGGGRYILSAFPVLVVVAEMLVDRPRVRAVVVPLSFVALCGFAVAFGRGSYLA